MSNIGYKRESMLPQKDLEKLVGKILTFFSFKSSAISRNFGPTLSGIRIIVISVKWQLDLT